MVCLSGHSFAATTTSVETKPTDQSAVDSTALVVGLKLRENAAAMLATGTEKPEATIARLKAHASPSGLKIDHDADFALAALEVGQRLIPKGKYAEAEKLFQEAEKSFVLVVAKTPDSAARDKAMLLQKLALIRGQYLNNPVQAKADIEAAIKLQPDEKYFQTIRDQLASSQGRIVSLNIPKN